MSFRKCLTVNNLSFNLVLFSVVKFLLFSVLFCSCVTAKRGIYFNNLQPTTEKIDKIYDSTFQKIQIGDRLSIIMNTKDLTQNEILNPLGLTRNNSTASGISGYQVQKDGTIELPIIGKLKVVNQTTDEISALIKNKLIVDYKEPYVYVNLIGRVIVLGSNSPGPVSLFNERLTILEAIALSGDVKFSSRKDRVWLIREQNGERKSVLLDLTSPEIFQSPYFYLKTNDLVYIEPSRFLSFIEGNAPSRNLFLSAVSIVALIIALIK